MNDLIQVFRMTELDAKIRASIIIKLGDLINHQYAYNLTEPIVFELVSQLDPKNKILKDQRYLEFYNKSK